jgi:hypothetical protein
MKKLDFGRTINTLANIGVIVGIAFLVVEIKQNTAMMQAQMTEDRAETAMEQAESLYNSGTMPEIFVAIDQRQRLDAVQTERFSIYLRAFNRNQDNILQQYEQGLLGEEVLRSVRDAVRVELAERPVAREIWNQTKQSYSDEYIALVDEVIANYSAGATN